MFVGRCQNQHTLVSVEWMCMPLCSLTCAVHALWLVLPCLSEKYHKLDRATYEQPAQQAVHTGLHHAEQVPHELLHTLPSLPSTAWHQASCQSTNLSLHSP